MRLTRYDDENRYYRPCDYESDKQSTILKLCKKLGQLEDIEEELGIDLITLFKILKRKKIYWVNEYNKKIQQMIMYGECDLMGIFVYEKGFEYPECSKHLLYKDYGKTWALTKEELQDENDK